MLLFWFIYYFIRHSLKVNGYIILFISLVHLFYLTSPYAHRHAVLLAFSDLPLALSLSLSYPLSQLLWPLNITQAVSAKLWMSLDTYSTQTPFGISIFTEPISIFIAGWVGSSVKSAVRISQSNRNKHLKRSLFLCVFVWFIKNGGSLGRKGNLNPPFGSSPMRTNYPPSFNSLTSIDL